MVFFKTEEDGVLGEWETHFVMARTLFEENYSGKLQAGCALRQHYARIVRAVENLLRERDPLLRWNSSFGWTCFPRNRPRIGGVAEFPTSRGSFAAI